MKENPLDHTHRLAHDVKSAIIKSVSITLSKSKFVYLVLLQTMALIEAFKTEFASKFRLMGNIMISDQ